MKRGQTKDNPLTWHYLIADMAKNAGMKTILQKVKLKKLPGRRQTKKGIEVIYNDQSYILLGGITIRKGGIKVYPTDSIDIPGDAEFNAIYQIQGIPLEEFPNYSELETVGKVKECDGGGWYSMLNVYKFKDKYYAKFECSRTMHEEYSKDSGLANLRNISNL